MSTAQPARPTSVKRAFTLVELLVVVGIIAILIAILMPALKRARDQANRIACQNNVRQLLIGCQMYVNENRLAWPFCNWLSQETSGNPAGSCPTGIACPAHTCASGVGDRASQSNVVLHEVLALGIRDQIFDVRLSHAIMPRAIPPVVWFVPFRHRSAFLQ